MNPISLPRPSADEFAPYYEQYITEAPGERIGLHLGEQLYEMEQLFGPLTDEQASYRYAPGKWSIKEVLGHVIDAERIFSYRLLRISRGDATPLPSFDEDMYVAAANFGRRSIADLLKDMKIVRASTLSLVDGVADNAWSNRGEMSGYPVSARAVMYILLGHAAHHMAVVRTRYGIGTPLN
jgi:hypothetical protein